MTEAVRGKIIVQADKIGTRVAPKLLSSHELGRINANGFFKRESQSELIIGVRETAMSILLYKISKKSIDGKYQYSVQYCNNDGTQQMRTHPDSKTKAGTKDREIFGLYYSYGGSGGMINTNTFNKIAVNPKDIVQIMEDWYRRSEKLINEMNVILQELEKKIEDDVLLCRRIYPGKRYNIDNPNDFIIDSNNDPYYLKLFGIFQSAENNIERSRLIDEVISSLKKEPPFDSEIHSRTYMVGKGIYMYFLIRNVCETFEIKLNPQQLEDLALIYYKFFSKSKSRGLVDIDKHFIVIANRHFLVLKSLAMRISSRLSLTGLRKKIFNKHLVLVESEITKGNFENQLKQISTAFEVLQPNKYRFYFKSVIIACPETNSMGPQRVSLTLYLEVNPTPKSIAVLRNRLQKEVGKRSPEENFMSLIFHEYGHILQGHSPKIMEVLNLMFSKLGPVQREIDFLGDYTPPPIEESSFALDAYEFGSIYIEAILKNTEACLEIALKRAGQGHYITLTMVLLTIGCLSPEKNSVNFLKSDVIDGELILDVHKVDKKAILDNIPSRYLRAIEEKYGLLVKELLNVGVLLPQKGSG